MTGKDPTAFDPADPLRLWIIQVGQFDTPSLFSRCCPSIQSELSYPFRYHHHHNSAPESWTPQATTASGHCRGAWGYSSRCVICSFLLCLSFNLLSRADCLWRYTRLFPTHFPLPVYTLSLSCSEHWPLSLPLPRRT